MTAEVRAALYIWVAGFIIGTIPLDAHFIYFLTSDPVQNWHDNWSNDILFISITTSGLSLIGLVGRTKKIVSDIISDAKDILITASSIAVCVGSGIVYGTSASGHQGVHVVITALICLASSISASLYFELTVAKRSVPATPLVVG